MSEDILTGFERWLAGSVMPQTETWPDWLEFKRRDAREWVKTQRLPHSKDEAWRYTSLKGLIEQGFEPVGETLTALRPDDLDEILVPGLDSYRLILVNGRHVPELSVLGGLPEGVRIGGLRDLLRAEPDIPRAFLDETIGTSRAFFSALNTAGLDDGLVVQLGRGVVLERPIELIHLSVGLDAPRVAQPRNLVVLDAGAQTTLIERYLGLGQSVYCTNTVTEISLGRDAVLKHERVQMESPNAFHISGLYLVQDENSYYSGANIGMGARWARTDLNTRFRGRHAECVLRGLYLAGDQQLMDYHLDVDHAVGDCRSEENFKGILHGRGRAVFDGRVLVAKDAQKTDAAMSNRNLMLSEQAEIDTKPQLEIYADDVKCSHGTTVGQIEPEMLFYLRSRGIDAVQARRMLCLGFAGEIIDRLGAEAVREHVAEAVGQRLA